MPFLLLWDNTPAVTTALNLSFTERFGLTDQANVSLPPQSLALYITEMIGLRDSVRGAVPLPASAGSPPAKELRFLFWVNGPNGVERYCTGDSVMIVLPPSDPNAAWMNGQYTRRILAWPTVSISWSDVYFGVVEPTQLQVQLDNTDEVLNAWILQDYRGKEARGVRFDVGRQEYVVEIEGLILGRDPAETILVDLVSIDTDVLQENVPDSTVATSRFPKRSIDSDGATEPTYYGWSEMVPLRYVGVYRDMIPPDKILDPTDTPDVFDYLIGKGNYGVPRVVREDVTEAIPVGPSGQDPSVFSPPLPVSITATLTAQSAGSMWGGIALAYLGTTTPSFIQQTAETGGITHAQSYVLTTTKTTVPGRTLFVYIVRLSGQGATAVTDSVGNSYARQASRIVLGLVMDLWAAQPVGILLPSGGQITVTFGTEGGESAIEVLEYAGLLRPDASTPVLLNGVGPDVRLTLVQPTDTPAIVLGFIVGLAYDPNVRPPTVGAGLQLELAASPSGTWGFVLVDVLAQATLAPSQRGRYLVSTQLYPGYTIVRFYIEQKGLAMTADVFGGYPAYQNAYDYPTGTPRIRAEYKFDQCLRDTGAWDVAAPTDGRRHLVATGFLDGDFTAGAIPVTTYRSAVLFSRAGQQLVIPASGADFLAYDTFCIRLVVSISALMQGVSFCLVRGPATELTALRPLSPTAGWVLNHVAGPNGTGQLVWSVVTALGIISFASPAIGYDIYHDVTITVWKAAGRYTGQLTFDGVVVQTIPLAAGIVYSVNHTNMQIPADFTAFLHARLDYLYFKDLGGSDGTGADVVPMREHRMFRRNGITYLRELFQGQLAVHGFDTADLDQAEADWDAINNGQGQPLDLANIELVTVKDVLDDVLKLRGGRLFRRNGRVTVELDTTKNLLDAPDIIYDTTDDTKSSGMLVASQLRFPRTELPDMARSLSLAYRPLRDPTGALSLLRTTIETALLARGQDLTIEAPFLHDHLAAAVFLLYYARKLIAADNQATFVLDEHAGRQLFPGKLVRLTSHRYGIVQQYYQITQMQRGAESHALQTIAYDPSAYQPPVDPVLPEPEPVLVPGAPSITNWLPYMVNVVAATPAIAATPFVAGTMAVPGTNRLFLIQQVYLKVVDQLSADLSWPFPDAVPINHVAAMADALESTFIESALGLGDQDELFKTAPIGLGNPPPNGSVVAIRCYAKCFSTNGPIRVHTLFRVGVDGTLGVGPESIINAPLGGPPFALLDYFLTDPDGNPWTWNTIIGFVDPLTLSTIDNLYVGVRANMSVHAPRGIYQTECTVTQIRTYAFYQSPDLLPSDFDALVIFRSIPFDTAVLEDLDGTGVMRPTGAALIGGVPVAIAVPDPKRDTPYAITHSLTFDDQNAQGGKSYFYWCCLRDTSGLMSDLTPIGLVTTALAPA